MKSLFNTKKTDLLSDKYSHKVSVPQYLPSNVKPNIQELFDVSKYSELMKHINDSNLSDEEKHFLKLGATRHIVFRYDKIADYYAHSSSEMQKLMEESALVIVDFNDAILYGYVELCKNMEQVMEMVKNDAR